MHVANQAGERQKAYSDDLRKTVIELAKSLPLEDILKLTACKKRTVERLLSTFRRTGKLRESPKGKRGRRSSVDEDTKSVSIFFLLFVLSSHYDR